MPTTDKVTKGWEKLQLARAHVRKHTRYFYNTVLGFVPRHVQGYGTLAVSQSMSLAVDMEWFSTLNDDVAAGCLIHEVMHILRDIRRIAAFDNAELANIAFDIPINADLRRFNIKLPPWAVYPETHQLPDGLTGEKYYDLLKDRCKTVVIQLSDGKTKSVISIDGIIYEGKVGAGGCGSCATGNDKDDHDHDANGRSNAEVLYFRKTGVQQLKEHLDKSGRGTIPASFRELLEFGQEEKPVVPWQSILNMTTMQVIGDIKSGQTDYSFRRLAKRTYTLGIIRPSLISYDINVAFVEDTSGSVNHKQLKAGRVEFASILLRLGISRAWFLQVDAALASKPRLVTTKDLLTLPVLGRGGTAFRPGIDAAMRLRPKPDLIVYSTDGMGEQDVGPKPRGVQFIWLLVPGDYTRSPCDWGKQILLSNDPGDHEKYQILQSA